MGCQLTMAQVRTQDLELAREHEQRAAELYAAARVEDALVRDLEDQIDDAERKSKRLCEEAAAELEAARRLRAGERVVKPEKEASDGHR